MNEAKSAKTDPELMVISVEELEDMVDGVLEQKNPTLTKEERLAMIHKVIESTGRKNDYLRYRSFKKRRTSKKNTQVKVAKVAGSLAMGVGSSAATGLAAAIVAPSAPVIAVAGAFVGLLGALLVSLQDYDLLKKNRQ